MEYVLLLIVAVAVVWIVVSASRLGGTAKKRFRGGLSGGLGVIDEAFRPATHDAQQIQQIEHELPAPAPLAGDPEHPEKPPFTHQ